MDDSRPKGARLERTPAVLLPYQQRWAADRSEVKIIEKSRRVGLSWAEAADCVTTAAKTNGEDCWYIGYTRDMAEEFILDCADWGKHLNQVVSDIDEYDEIWVEGAEEKSCKAFRVTFASGWRISALSSSPRNLRGKQGRVIIDEAAFHDDLAELLKAAMALLMWGGRVHIISTHNGDENPFNDLIQEVRAKKKPYSLHRITFDEACAEGLYRRICMRKKQQWSIENEAKWMASIRAKYGDDAEEELDCVPARGGGVWLSRALIEARMHDELTVVRYTAPAGMDLWTDRQIEAEVGQFISLEIDPVLKSFDPRSPSTLGEDFGRYSDLTSIVCMQIVGFTRRVPLIVELSNTPHVAQRMILVHIALRLPMLSRAKLDAGGNGSYLAEELRRFLGADRVDQILFTEAWYRDNTAQFKAAMQADDGYQIPRDPDVANDLSAIRKIKGVPRVPDLRAKSASGVKRHGDTAIALLLADAASREELYMPLTYDSARHRDIKNLSNDDDEDDDYGRDVKVTAGFTANRGAW